MIELARQRLGDRAELRQGDASDLPYPDGYFDLILAATFLHELEAPTRLAALSEMKRTLKNDGRVLVIDFHPGRLRPPRGWLWRGLSFGIERVAGANHFRHFREFMIAGGLPELAASRGLTIEQERIVAGGNMGLYLLRIDPPKSQAGFA